MKELAAMCEDLGFKKVRTYIQSGNVVFESSLSEKQVQSRLEQALAKKMGKPVDVMLRSSAELAAILKGNPFPQAEPARVAVVFVSQEVPKELPEIAGPDGEQVRPGKRELYVYYPKGMGRSKLKIPSSVGPVTARNINTVTKLVAMAVS